MIRTLARGVIDWTSWGTIALSVAVLAACGGGGSSSGGGNTGGDDVDRVVVCEGSESESLSCQVDENHGGVLFTFSTMDEEGNPLSYSFVDEKDGHLFTVDPETGELSFVSAPDAENPADVDGDNVYDITLQVQDVDGQVVETLEMVITVSDKNDPPVFTSGETAQAAENGVGTIYTATATDDDGDPITFSLSDDGDSGLFTFDPETSELVFVSAPDFENPADANGDNVYEITLLAKDDSGLSTPLLLAITVTDQNESPLFSSAETAQSAENSLETGYIAAATDIDGDAVVFSVSGGADSALFTIDSETGALSFVGAPNFENPADADQDNVYEVTLQVEDGGGLTDALALTVTITDGNEPPVLTSSQTAVVAENSVETGYTATAADEDAGDSLTFSILSVGDGSLFKVNPSTGTLSFVVAPNFENPADANGDNVYDITLQAQDDGGLVGTRALAITVTDQNDRPVFTSAGTAQAAENSVEIGYIATATDADGDTVVYSVSGGADSGQFTIDPASGELSFAAAQDFENPADAGGDNVYNVTLLAEDGGGLSDSLPLAVTVTDQNDRPVFTSAETAEAMENSVETGYSATATDADGDAVVFSVSGGADSNLFIIDPATGALSFTVAPDFENPADGDGDNVYNVALQVEDGAALTDTLTLTVTVTNQNDPPVFTSGEMAQATENSVVTDYTATATDEDGDAVVFSVLNEGDSGLFIIDADTGVLSFGSSPDFEIPADADADNVYEVTLQVNDPEGGTAQKVVMVSVTDESWAELRVTYPTPNANLMGNVTQTRVAGVVVDGDTGLSMPNHNITQVSVDGINATFDVNAGHRWQVDQVPLNPNQRYQELQLSWQEDGATSMVQLPLQNQYLFESIKDVVWDETYNRAVVTGLAKLFAVDLVSGERTHFSSDLVGTGPAFGNPQRITMDAGANQILVADNAWSTETVTGVDLATGNRRVISGPDVGVGPDFDVPFAIARDDTGSFGYVADSAVEALFRVDLDTGARTLISDSAIGSGPAISNPLDIAYDGANNRVLINESSTSEVLAVDLDTGDRTTLIDSLPWMRGGSIDNSNNRYLVARDFELLGVDLATGEKTILSGSAVGTGDPISESLGVDVNSAGSEALLVDIKREALLKVDLATGNRTVVSANSVGEGEPLQGPVGLAQDRKNNRVLLVDNASSSGRLVSVDLASGARTLLASRDVGTGPELEFSAGIAPDFEENRVFLTTWRTWHVVGVLELDLATGHRRVISAVDGSEKDVLKGSGPVFSRPKGMVLDKSNNRLLLLDSGLKALLEVDIESGDRRIISDADTGTGIELARLESLVLDSDNNRVLLVNSGLGLQGALVAVDLATGDREVLSQRDVLGDGPALHNPTGLVLDRVNNRVLVSHWNGVSAVDLASGARTLLYDSPYQDRRSLVHDDIGNRLLMTNHERNTFEVLDLTGMEGAISSQ